MKNRVAAVQVTPTSGSYAGTSPALDSWLNNDATSGYLNVQYTPATSYTASSIVKR